MISVRILGTGSALPERVVTTSELALLIGRRPEAMERKTGIRTRHWMNPGTRCTDLAVAALGEALARAALPKSALRRIIFVCSTGGDQLLPANANRVAADLGLRGTC